jgi:hypothetical protein
MELQMDAAGRSVSVTWRGSKSGKLEATALVQWEKTNHVDYPLSWQFVWNGVEYPMRG